MQQQISDLSIRHNQTKGSFIIRSRSQSRIKQSRHFSTGRYNNQNNDNDDKMRNKIFHLGQRYKPFIVQKQRIQNQLLNLDVVQKNIKIQRLLKKLHALFIHYKISQFYSYFFMKSLSKTKQQTIQDAINRQINSIKQKQSHYQIISSSVKARQGCLTQLRVSLQNLFNNSQDQNSYRKFREQIQHYRRLTCVVIKLIKDWKQYIDSLVPMSQNEEFPAFFYKDEDYFITLLNDNMFIFNSFLSTYVNFSNKNDPFIMRPFLDKKQNKYTSLFAVTQQQKDQYVVWLNYLAEQRAKYLRRKVQIKDQKIKQIQKAYQSNRLSQSMNSSFFNPKLQKTSLIKQKVQLKNHIDIDFVDNSLFKSKIKIQQNDHQNKMNQMKRIKSILSSANPLVSRKKISSFLQQQSKQLKKLPPNNFFIGKSIYQSPVRQKITDCETYDDDFTKMMRKKQLVILEEAQNLKNSRNNFRGLKIKDSLSTQRKKININNQSCLNDLQDIVANLQNQSSFKLDNFKIISKSQAEQQNFQMSPKKLKPIPVKKTLLEHNQQVIKQMRDQIIKQIQQEKKQKQKIEIIKKLQNQRVQSILQQKINQNTLTYIKQAQSSRLTGKKQLIKDLGKQAQFGQQLDYQSQLKNSKKLTQLEQQLKKQFHLKWLRQVHQQLKRKTQISQIQLQRMRQQQKLSNQVKKIEQKQQRQRQYRQIEIQQRAKAIKFKIQLQEQRKKEIQKEMQQAIKQEKQKLQKFSIVTKINVQQQLKQQMKKKMLEQLKKQKNKYFQNKKLTQEQLRLKQAQYRQEVRKKLQKQYKIQDIVKKQGEKEEKQRKLKMIQQKFEHYDQKLKNSKLNASRMTDNSNINNSKVIHSHLKAVNFDSNAKNQLLQVNGVINKQSEIRQKKFNENQKKKMREEFQIQLFAFMKPQIYSKKDQNSQFLIKDIKSIVENSDKLNNKQKILQEQLNKIKQQQRNISIIEQQNLDKSSVILSNKMSDSQSQVFERFSQNSLAKKEKKIQQIANATNMTKISPSKTKIKQSIALNQQDQVKRIRLQMSVQEYLIYKKKKQIINKNKKVIEIQQKKKIDLLSQKKKLNKISEEFELINFQDNQEQKNQNNYEVQRINYQNQFVQDNQTENFKKLTVRQMTIEKPQLLRSQNTVNIMPDTSFNNKQIDSQSIQNSQIQKISKQKIKKLTIRSQKRSFNRFATSQSQNSDEDYFQENNKLKVSKLSKSKSKVSQSKNQLKSYKNEIKPNKNTFKKDRQDISNLNQQYQRTQSAKKQFDIKSKQVQLNKQNNPYKKQPQTKQTLIKHCKISDQKLHQYMKQHFEHIPKVIKHLNLHKRDQLIRILRQDHKQFIILQYIQQNILVGICILIHNQKKTKIRSFNIIHLGCYDQSDIVILLRKSSEYLFKYDPCEQITMSMFYHTDKQQEEKVIKKVQKQFDKYGVIFQKKIFNTQFQRKHVLRRMIGDKTPLEKQKLNLGQIYLHNDLYVSQQFIGNQNQHLQKPGLQIGIYGYLSLYITQHIDQILLQQIIKSQNKQIKPAIKHLAKQAINIHQNYNNIGQFQSIRFPSVFEMNLKLHQVNKQLIRCQAQYLEQQIPQYWNSQKLNISIAFPFVSLKAKFKLDDDQYTCDYFRFKIQENQNKSKNLKNIIIKSKIFSSQIIVMPCKNTKYKIFVLSSMQFDDLITKKKQMNLDIYIKLFFANLHSHQISQYQYIWLPQFKTVSQLNCNQQMSPFNRYNSTIKSYFSFYHTSYLQNSAIHKPTHRDLMITPSFIIGVLDNQMQLVSEGTPLYVKKINIGDLLGLKEMEKVVDTD